MPQLMPQFQGATIGDLTMPAPRPRNRQAGGHMIRGVPPPPELTPTGLGPTPSMGPVMHDRGMPQHPMYGGLMPGAQGPPQINPAILAQFGGALPSLPRPGIEAWRALHGSPANTGFAGPMGGAGVPHAFPPGMPPPGAFLPEMGGVSRGGGPVYPFGQPNNGPPAGWGGDWQGNFRRSGYDRGK